MAWSRAFRGDVLTRRDSRLLLVLGGEPRCKKATSRRYRVGQWPPAWLKPEVLLPDGVGFLQNPDGHPGVLLPSLKCEAHTLLGLTEPQLMLCCQSWHGVVQT